MKNLVRQGREHGDRAPHAGRRPAAGVDDRRRGIAHLADHAVKRGVVLHSHQVGEPLPRQRLELPGMDADMMAVPVGRGMRASVDADLDQMRELAEPERGHRLVGLKLERQEASLAGLGQDPTELALDEFRVAGDLPRVAPKVSVVRLGLGARPAPGTEESQGLGFRPGLEPVARLAAAPTRCGKSQILQSLSKGEGRTVAGPGSLIPGADFRVAAIPPRPNERDIYKAPLRACDYDCSDREKTEAVRRRVFRVIRDHGIRIIALDEANHLAESGANLPHRSAGDHFKSIVDETGVGLILAGLPKFQTIVDGNEQFRDRCHATIRYLPYDWHLEADRGEFYGAVSTILDRFRDSGVAVEIDEIDCTRRLGRTGRNDALAYARGRRGARRRQRRRPDDRPHPRRRRAAAPEVSDGRVLLPGAAGRPRPVPRLSRDPRGGGAEVHAARRPRPGGDALTRRAPFRAVEPEPGESLLGFFHRLADVNGYADGASLLALVGRRYGRALIEELPAVARSLGLQQGVLASRAPSAQPVRPVLEWRFERFRSNPICPACVAERRPHAEAWRHCFVTACTVHDLLLQDVCPRCRSRLTPRDGGFRACACGHPLAEFDRVPAPTSDLAVSALVAGHRHPSRRTLPPPFVADTPPRIGQFLFFLASREQPAMTGKQGKAALPIDVAGSRAFLEPAADMLGTWPDRFDAHVRDRLAAGDPSSQTAPGRLGNWYQALMRFREENYRPFRERLATVIAEEFDGAYRGASATETGETGSWVSAAEAARSVGIRAERLVAAVASGEIEGRLHRSGFGHRHCTVRRETVTVIAETRRRFRDARAVAALLGVSRNQMALLTAAGVLPVAKVRPVLADGVIDAVELEKAVAAIRARVCPRPGPTIRFRDINLRRTTDRGAVLDVLRAVFDGSIAPVAAPSGGPLAAIEFLVADVDEALARRRRVGGWTVQEVAGITGWKEQCVAEWCRQGLIESTPFVHGRGIGRIVEPRALAAFQSTFVTVAALARASGRAPRAVLHELLERGVATIGDFPDGPARRGHLVRIADLAVPSSLPSRARAEAPAVAPSSSDRQSWYVGS